MATKRSKGARRNGQMVQRAPGKWLLRAPTGVTGDGTRRYKNETFLGTTSQAQKKLTELMRSRDTQTLVASSKLTVSDYLDTWVASKSDVTPKTRESYRYQLGYVKKHLGGMKLTDLSTLAIQECVSKMSGEGLSPRTVEYNARILHIALADAVKGTLLIRNPAADLKLPKKIKREASVLSMQQVALLLAATADKPLGVLWRLLLTTGMRPSEAFALKWSDIDFDGSWVCIRRTLVGVNEDGKSVYNPAKAGSERRPNLPASTVDALRAHRKIQAAEILKAGKAYDRTEELVFAKPLGQPLDIDQVRRQWKAALKATKVKGKSLPEIRLYDARHSHATALLAEGADIAWVAQRLGHKDISMTVRHYAHVLQESQRAMGDMTERMLAKAQAT